MIIDHTDSCMNVLFMLWKAIDHVWKLLIIAMNRHWSCMITYIFMSSWTLSWPLIHHHHHQQGMIHFSTSTPIVSQERFPDPRPEREWRLCPFCNTLELIVISIVRFTKNIWLFAKKKSHRRNFTSHRSLHFVHNFAHFSHFCPIFGLFYI